MNEDVIENKDCTTEQLQNTLELFDRYNIEDTNNIKRRLKAIDEIKDELLKR